MDADTVMTGTARDAGRTAGLPTGIQEALVRLDTLDALPTSAHVEIFEEMNSRLADALADLDGSAPGSPGAARPAR